MMKILSTFLLLLVLPCSFSFAGQTKYHVMKGVGAFLKGDFSDTQIDDNGNLLIGPHLQEVVDTKNLLIQSMVQTSTGFYVGTAQSEEIYFYDFKTKKERLIYSGSKLSIAGMTLTKDGLYFAQMPSNNIYFISNEQLNTNKVVDAPKLITTLVEPTYIWGLNSINNALYAITGSKAQLYKIALGGKEIKPQLVWDAKDEKHLITLTKKGDALYIGGQGRGGVYHFDSKTEKIETLYQTYEGEVSDILVDQKGVVYFTTSSKEPKKPGSDFNYTDAFLLQQMEYKMTLSKLLDAGIEPQKALLMAESRDGEGAPKMAIKNSLYSYDNKKVNKLFTLDNNSLNSIAKTKEGLLLVGSSAGKMLSYDLSLHKVSLLATVTDEEVIAIRSVAGTSYFATSNLGRIYALKEDLPSDGEYISRVMDLGSRSQLGRIEIESQEQDLGSVKVYVRGGQNKDVDKNWGDFQGPYTVDSLKSVSLNNVRYIQYKIELKGKNRRSPVLNSIKVAFVGDNAQPSINLFNVFYDYQNPNVPPYLLTLQWDASDADQDKISYTLYFKEKKDIQWQILAETSDQKKLPLDTRLLPDGSYEFKLKASDELDNTKDRVNSAQQEVSNIIVDNTPPEIKIIGMGLKKNKVSIKGVVEDKESIILKAYYKIGLEGNWHFISPENGMYDRKKIDFTINDTLPQDYKKNLENFVFIRALDANRNQRVIKTKIQ